MDVFEPSAAAANATTAVNDIDSDARVDFVDLVADESAVALPQTGLGAVARRLFRVLCWFMLAAAVVYLGVAGMNYALISGVQIPEELRGTKILLTYSAAQALLFSASGIAGLVGESKTDAQRYLRLAPLVPAALVIAAEATHMFNMGDHVLDNRFIFGANFFFGILAVLAGALAAVSLYLSKGQDGSQRAAGSAVVAFDTDPVLAETFPSSETPADTGSAQDSMMDEGSDVPVASREPADEDGDAQLGLETGDEPGDEYREEGELEGGAVEDLEDEEEEVERPHGAHF